MSGQTVSISITAKDGTKSTFDAIKRGADQDAAALKGMGAAGASSGQQVAAGAKAGESALKSQSAAIKDVQIGAAALGVAFTMASRAAVDQGRQIDAINRLYGESANEILKVTEAIQDNTNFSNDAARQAAITGATLASNYQISAEQIGVLIERSANLAQIHGVDLADAMTRVSGAIRGEGEAAELLGLNMSDSAVATAAAAAGIENWTTGATEAEKAAFRYSLVLEQTNATLGAAQDAHNTTAGTVRGLVNQVQDGAQAFAEWTGPVGQSAAALSDYALQAGVALGGVVKLGEGLRALAATGALSSAALGPVGLALAAGAAAFAIYKVGGAADASDASVKIATEGIKTYEDALASLASQSSALSLTGQAWEAEVESIMKHLTLMQGQVLAGTPEEIQQRYGAAVLVELQKVLTATGPGAQQARADMQALLDTLATAPAVTTDMLAGVTNISDNLAIYDQNAIIAAESTKNLALAQAGAADAFTTIGAAVDNLGTKYEDTAAGQQMMADLALIQAEGTDAMKESLQRLFPAFEAGTDKANIFTNTVKLNAAILREEAAAADAAAKAINDSFARATDRQAAAQEQQTKNIADAASAHKTIGDSAANAAVGVDKLGHAFEMTEEDIAAATQAALDHATANNRWGPQIAAATEAQRLQREELDATVASLHQYADALGAAGSFASQLRPVDLAPKGGDKATGSAAKLQQVGSALDSVLGTFKELDSLGQSASQAGSIAENLVGDPGEIATIDRLLNQGRISQTAYNEAVKAGYQIQKEQGAVENDLNVIRAKQLPLLADADREYGNLIDKISKMDAETQQATLGFMDQNEAMKAQNALSLVAAASMGELGASGKQATQDILQGATDADPVLKEMLKSIGLITEDKEGNIKINFENGAEVQATLDDVVSSIDQVAIAIDLLDGVADLDITVKFQADQAKKDAADTKAAIDDIPTEHNTDITEKGSDSTRTAARGTREDVELIPPSHNTDITQAGAEDTQGAANNTTSAVNNIPFLHNVDITASDSASGTIAYVAGLLNDLDGQSATVFVNTVTNSVPQNPLSGVFAGGGIVTAAGGRLTSDLQRVRVNEGGMEMATLPTGDDVWLPQGSMVTPHAASKYGRSRTESGKPVNFWGTVNVYTSNPDDFIRQMQTYGVAGR